ncbi:MULTISPECIES: LGFP repeat-containing protein [unclassified Actinoplanes]|uniref:LGFP repeat-containing protein n=1 Tax=unclassified Actinoplanes TaxID=2626549 RepID=UPI0012F90B56|nr:MULTISPECIES: esterase [unclassified Actinoplanes]
MKRGAWTVVTLGLAAATVFGAVPARADESKSADKSATYCRLRVHGGILSHYRTLGSDKGRLGCPMGIEQSAAGGGRMQQFDGGSIYWSAQTGAHAVAGRILQLWQGNRGEAGCVGYPVDEESDTPDHRGRYQHFQRGTIWHWNDGRVSAVC